MIGVEKINLIRKKIINVIQCMHDKNKLQGNKYTQNSGLHFRLKNKLFKSLLS